MKHYAIYMDIRGVQNILLTDGAWTDPRNANRESDIAQYGFYLHKPKLFYTRREAKEFALQRNGFDQRISVHEYTERVP